MMETVFCTLLVITALLCWTIVAVVLVRGWFR
jgi:uncharacterized membrane protein (GlpM family)